jgi:hypothetical protein
LELHRSEANSDGVFVRLHSTIVLTATNDWDDERVRTILQDMMAPGLTAGQLGVTWNKLGAGQQTYAELNGLSPLAVASRGKYLMVSNNPESVSAVLERLPERTNSEPAVYAAGFDHARERENFYKLTTLIDRPSRMGAGNGEPQFFSQNVASLSKIFEGLKSESIVVRRSGALETQTVRYGWSH